MSSESRLKRSIGPVGAAIILIGFVVGISIFVLPGTLAAQAGPAVILSYAIAAVMAVFSCVVAAQVGGVLPVSGASFVLVSRLVSATVGFCMVWLMVGAATASIALLSLGFADYFFVLWPGPDRTVLALGLVLVLGVINLFGIKHTAFVQGFMVAVFLAALGIFVAASLNHMDATLLVPWAPNGIGPVLAAAIPAYFSFSGFMVIVEIGGEIRDPGRNIPRALAISFIAVLVLYSMVCFSIVGIIPWHELGKTGAPVGTVAQMVLPAWLAQGITLAAVAAAASSVNVMLLGYSRDILALARVRALPERLARISARHGVPASAVLVITLLSAVAILLDGSIRQYATAVVVAVLLAQIVIAVAMLRLSKTLPSLLQGAKFRLASGKRAFFCYGLITLSLAFMVMVLVDSPHTALITVAYLSVGVIYFFLRRHWLLRRGISVEANIKEEVERAIQA